MAQENLTSRIVNFVSYNEATTIGPQWIWWLKAFEGQGLHMEEFTEGDNRHNVEWDKDVFYYCIYQDPPYWTFPTWLITKASTDWMVVREWNNYFVYWYFSLKTKEICQQFATHLQKFAEDCS